jgi:ribosomal protein S27AE
MAAASVHCPKCGESVDLVPHMVGEIIEVGVDNFNVFGVARQFSATCPKCGPFRYDRPGHHGTITKKQMKEMFSIKARKEILKALPKEERKRFKDTMAGKREPKDGDVEHWLAVQSSSA